MKDQERTPHPIYRKDYTPPDFLIDNVDLQFELGEETTRVRAVLSLRRNPAVTDRTRPLVLQGQDLALKSVRLDGTVLSPSDYQLSADSLTLPNLPDVCRLETLVEIRPQENTSLSGLYKSSGNFCTQCEAEGFRHITYFLDRPDVMTRFSTTIIAEAQRYPVLLSNGNRISQEILADGRQQVRWEDPFLKPSYLFALVAGQLHCHAGEFITSSGRRVRLEIWVEPQNIDKCQHALLSLQKAMRWDEEVYGLEYDLDTYMIVAVSDFNMGAMENKGLNVFNAKFVLARADTATDEDYEDIEGVIAHEYFHNWTGNRVTCRDWFQLTLKEGLTVFRDEQFTADMTSAATKRIKEVKLLRMNQFEEDQGPMAHPIRPDSYIEMSNFYTVTVYSKGSEVIRMIHTLLGAAGFRKGMDLYFQRHDGQAVTCDDFRAAMADANQLDLQQFERWYDQAGTPLLEAEGRYDASLQRYSLRLRQSPSKPGLVENWQPWQIPVAVGLLSPDGADFECRLVGAAHPQTTHVLTLSACEQVFEFEAVPSPPVLSILRNFSAPVKLQLSRSLREWAFLMAHDSDTFNRWDAGHTLAQTVLLGLAADWAAGRPLVLDAAFADAFIKVLEDPTLDGSIKALMLDLPEERLLAQQQAVVDVAALYAAREFLRQALAQRFETAWRRIYHAQATEAPYCYDKPAVDQRQLKNRALDYLVALQRPDTAALALHQFSAADNMTDVQAALSSLANIPGHARDTALQAFYDKWRHDPLVLDKWFAIQAQARLPDTLARVEALAQHPDFSWKNPNRVRALVGVFSTRNPVCFHAENGRGYQFLTEQVLALDALNPQIAARMAAAFNQWRRYDATRQQLIQAQLERILAKPGLSKDVYEIVSKSLSAH